VDGGIDTGDIFFKRDLDLYGTAEEIFMRASKIIFNDMIPELLTKRPVPQKQEGEATVFQRRKPEQSEISPILIWRKYMIISECWTRRISQGIY